MAINSAAAVPLLLRIVHDSTSIVTSAGRIVRNILKTGNLDIVDKGVNDLQTKADRVAQQYIVDKLSSKFPKATIIGEEPEGMRENMEEFLEEVTGDAEQFREILDHSVPENIHSIKEEEVVIWVDPLDGTGEFTQGLLEHVTVLVGIVFNGSPVGGVIHQPFVLDPSGKNGKTMWGIPGVGFGGFQMNKPPAGQRIITTTRSHSNPRVEAALQALKPDNILRVGGAGHKATLLFDGTAHAYVFASPGCKKWDTCAPEAILTAIGGKLTDMNGNNYKYNKDVEFVNEGGLLATAPGEDHDWYVQHIPPE